jgi:hypothetical protein
MGITLIRLGKQAARHGVGTTAASLTRTMERPMPQAEGSNITPAPEIPPPEDIVNVTFDPLGRTVISGVEKMFSTEQRHAFATVFRTKHAIADEIERLLAILDALDGDPDLEMNVNADDPRLDDAEGDAADDEPSLVGFDGGVVYFGQFDLEDDPAEAGVADLDGLAEQIGRAA